MSDSKLTRFLAWEPHKDSETTLTLLTNLIAAQENDKGYHWCVWLENKIIGLDQKETISTGRIFLNCLFKRNSRLLLTFKEKKLMMRLTDEHLDEPIKICLYTCLFVI